MYVRDYGCMTTYLCFKVDMDTRTQKYLARQACKGKEFVLVRWLGLLCHQLVSLHSSIIFWCFLLLTSLICVGKFFWFMDIAKYKLWSATKFVSFHDEFSSFIID